MCRTDNYEWFWDAWSQFSLQMLLRKEINVSLGQLLMILWSMIKIFLQMLLRNENNVYGAQLLMILWSMVTIFVEMLQRN